MGGGTGTGGDDTATYKDAPVYLSHLERIAWAIGYNAALKHVEAFTEMFPDEEPVSNGVPYRYVDSRDGSTWVRSGSGGGGNDYTYTFVRVS